MWFLLHQSHVPPRGPGLRGPSSMPGTRVGQGQGPALLQAPAGVQRAAPEVSRRRLGHRGRMQLGPVQHVARGPAGSNGPQEALEGSVRFRTRTRPRKGLLGPFQGHCQPFCLSLPEVPLNVAICAKKREPLRMVSNLTKVRPAVAPIVPIILFQAHLVVEVKCCGTAFVAALRALPPKFGY